MSANREFRGEIFNIQRFSTHDGPGIRTTVFLKGCPLHCYWCQNPESQNIKPVLLYTTKLCVGCGRCIPACEKKAISRDGRYVATDRSLCRGCGACVGVCPAEARSLAGETISVKELVRELKKDEKEYENSDGGITISGGDPIYQHDFALEILKACREELWHTAIETSGYAPWDILEPLVRETDYIFLDLKCMDSERHRKGTGVPNELILENAKRIAGMGKKVHFRMPLIPGFNDDDASVLAMKEFVEEELHLPAAGNAELLKYNKMAEDKFEQLGRNSERKDLTAQSDERFEYLKSLLYGEEYERMVEQA